ncbi:MAG: hypothetical protein ABSG13_23090 [Bryobacteraceae bacterium]
MTFGDNASGFLSAKERDRLAEEIDRPETLPNGNVLLHETAG